MTRKPNKPDVEKWRRILTRATKQIKYSNSTRCPSKDHELPSCALCCMPNSALRECVPANISQDLLLALDIFVWVPELVTSVNPPGQYSVQNKMYTYLSCSSSTRWVWSAPFLVCMIRRLNPYKVRGSMSREHLRTTVWVMSSWRLISSSSKHGSTMCRLHNQQSLSFQTE